MTRQKGYKRPAAIEAPGAFRHFSLLTPKLSKSLLSSSDRRPRHRHHQLARRVLQLSIFYSSSLCVVSPSKRFLLRGTFVQRPVIKTWPDHRHQRLQHQLLQALTEEPSLLLSVALALLSTLYPSSRDALPRPIILPVAVLKALLLFTAFFPLLVLVCVSALVVCV